MQRKQKTLIVTLLPHSRRVNKQIETDLYWYDSESGKMNKYRGTRLVFDYNPQSKRSTPRVVIDDIPVYRNSWEDIDSFLKNKTHNITVTEINARYSAEFEVDADEFMRNVEQQLRNLNIRYNVEEKHDEDKNRHRRHSRTNG